MKFINETKKYLVEVKEEMKKVSWPAKERAIKDSVVVVAISLATAAFLGAVDYLLSYLVDRFIV